MAIEHMFLTQANFCMWICLYILLGNLVTLFSQSIQTRRLWGSVQAFDLLVAYNRPFEICYHCIWILPSPSFWTTWKTNRRWQNGWNFRRLDWMHTSLAGMSIFFNPCRKVNLRICISKAWQSEAVYDQYLHNAVQYQWQLGRSGWKPWPRPTTANNFTVPRCC